MIRRTQRWEPSKAALARQWLLVQIADGRWYVLERGPDRQRLWTALVQLEQRGLVQVDRERRPTRFRVILPESAWLADLERWFGVLLEGAER